MFIGNLNSIGNLPISGGASYLLDTYTAAAAYSLRQLKTGVTNVVRVRRSSDSAESDFTATEITDGTLTTWTGANDGFVVTWYDQAGSNDATQSTAGSQAQIVSSGSLITAAGGLPAVDNASPEHYTLTGVSVTQEMTQVSVYSRATTTIDSAPTLSATTAAGYIAWQRASDDTLRSFGTVGDADTQTGNFLWEVLRDSSNNVSTNLNGVAKTGYVDADTFTATQLLKRYSVQYHNGKFQELILWQTDETANITDIRSDINTYYSIY